VSGEARSGQHWEGAAPDWIDWARAPGHDAFWAYRDALRSFLPPPGRATLEVGCGEGRVARELTELGHTVTATDVTPSLLEAAREVGSARSYVLADRGRFRGDDPGAPFTISGSYFGREHFSARVTGGSHSMTFDGWSHPLQDYMAALANAGMAITGLREPAPDVDRVPNLAKWTRLPMFLWINAVSLGQPSR
jgi:SAM-dependent methyltransferase